MAATSPFLSSSEAARRLGVSIKALRLYEQRGLVVPARSLAGWRAYGPAHMARASGIVALRALGLSLRQVAQLLTGDGETPAQALSAQESRLEGQIRQGSDMLRQLRALKVAIARNGATDTIGVDFGAAPTGPVLTFNLPWPWGGERFELNRLKRLNYIIGPLGSGKTRLAHAIADNLPGATFLGLDRLAGSDGPGPRRHDPLRSLEIRQTMDRLVAAGADQSEALTVLIAALEADGSGPLVIDMVEQDLDEASQRALISHLREGGAHGRTLFMLTRSRAILDLDCATDTEQVILCPANHSPPTLVSLYPGMPGYEAVATCLASPAVRARTEGVIACRSPAA